MGYSYQQQEVRLRQLERKVEYIMKNFTTIVESKIIGGKPQVKTMLDLYLEAEYGGKDVVETKKEADSNTYVVDRAGNQASSPSGSVKLTEVGDSGEAAQTPYSGEDGA